MCSKSVQKLLQVCSLPYTILVTSKMLMSKVLTHHLQSQRRGSKQANEWIFRTGISPRRKIQQAKGDGDVGLGYYLIWGGPGKFPFTGSERSMGVEA